MSNSPESPSAKPALVQPSGDPEADYQQHVQKGVLAGCDLFVVNLFLHKEKLEPWAREEIKRKIDHAQMLLGSLGGEE